MALQKRSVLKKLLITFEETGAYIAAECLFDIGAWDTETEDWHGLPETIEDVIHTSTPEGKKRLNDVLGTAVLKALETVEISKKAVIEAEAAAAQATKERIQAVDDRDTALRARDNFAAVEKKTRGELMSMRTYADQQYSLYTETDAKLRNIPRLIRRLFGAI